MKVFCHIVVPSHNQFRNCTLALETIRTGFPTADITIHWSPNPTLTMSTVGMGDCVEEKAKEFGLKNSFLRMNRPVFHADYITSIFNACRNPNLYDPDEPIVLLDGDIIFWKDCEPLVHSTQLWKGFYVPEHLNEWSHCRSVSRIHPSFLCIKSPKKLYEAFVENNPTAYNYTNAEYNGYRPFHPVTVYERAKATFFDTLAVGYQTIGAEIFSEEELDCYDHVNSACFYDSCCERFCETTKANFQRVHELAKQDPTKLKGLWKEIKNYYIYRRDLLLG